MWRAARVSSVGLALALLLLTCATAEAARRGRVTGVVLDQAGIPVAGASVAVFVADTEADTPVHNAVTNDEGRFTVSVAPGNYLLRAAATGFTAFEARALVASNRETVLDAIALRREGTLADRRRTEGNAYRRVVRSSRGHVFNIDEEPEAVRELDDAALLAEDESHNSMHGALQFLGAAGETAYSSTNFALTRRALGSDVTVTAQLGAGPGAPRRFEALARKDAGENHELAVAFGYGTVEARRDGERVPLGQYAVQVTDRWNVSGPLVLLYGFNYSKFTGASEDGALLPRISFELTPSNRTMIFGGLEPGSTAREVASFDLETGRVSFEEPQAAALEAGRARSDRSRRLELGVGHLIDERSNVEVMAFFDTASGKAIGLLAMPTPGGSAEFTTGELNGRTSGVRVLYTRQLSQILSATVGYSAGRGQELSSAALAEPASAFKSGTFNIVAARLEAAFDTGTRVSAVYRLGPGAVVFAIDPFAGRLTTYEPSAGIFVAQELPDLGFLPGRWEATLDVRNLFDVRPLADEGELTLADYSRLVRAGLSLRF